MSEAGVTRKERTTPERQLTQATKETDKQLDLLEDADEAPTPEEQAEEHKRQIEALTKQNEENSRRASEAERQAQAERTQRVEAQTGALSAQEKAVQGQIDTNTRMIEQARSSLKAARDNGDSDAEFAAIEALSDAKANLVNLNGQKQYLEAVKKQGPAEQVRQTQVQDTFRGKHGYSKASEDWIDQHPEFDSSPRFKSLVIGAAQAALTQHPADSYGFFKYLDDVVAEDKALMTKVNPQQTQQTQQRGPRASSIAAGPSRESQRQSNGNGPSAATIAQKLGVTVGDLQDYAKIARMPLDKYLAEQALIIQEQSEGKDTGLYRGESRS